MVKPSHGELIAKINDAELQITLADEVERDGLSVRELEHRVSELLKDEQSKAMPTEISEFTPNFESEEQVEPFESVKHESGEQPTATLEQIEQHQETHAEPLGQSTDEQTQEAEIAEKQTKEETPEAEVLKERIDTPIADETVLDIDDGVQEEIPEIEADNDESDTSGNPEYWKTFITYWEWIEDYCANLLLKKDIEPVGEIYIKVENLKEQLEDELPELAAELAA